jgi:hypothetical protein
VNLQLIRDFSNAHCTLGTLRSNGVMLQTLERPWIGTAPGGAKGISCVLPGTYQLVKHDSEAHPRSFALVNPDLHVWHYEVPFGLQGRTTVLIHVANRPEELRGCIALGMERNGDGIGRSRLAVNRFYAALPWEDGAHTLTIEGIPA